LNFGLKEIAALARVMMLRGDSEAVASHTHFNSPYFAEQSGRVSGQK
jgi:hypothetical protein